MDAFARNEFLAQLEIDFQSAEDNKLHSAAELKQIAHDIYEGRIFTEAHCRNQREFNDSFGFVLGMCGPELGEDILRRHAGSGLLYEYMDKAAPLGINGIPMFFSLKLLRPIEAKYVWKTVDRIENAMKAI